MNSTSQNTKTIILKDSSTCNECILRYDDDCPGEPRPCCTGSCRLDECKYWMNCELWLDGFQFPLHSIRMDIEDCLMRIRECKEDLDSIMDGDYYSSYAFEGVRGELKTLEFELARLRNREFEELRGLRSVHLKKMV